MLDLRSRLPIHDRVTPNSLCDLLSCEVELKSPSEGERDVPFRRLRIDMLLHSARREPASAWRAPS